MPSTKWFNGSATATAQVDTYTPGGTITTGDVNNLTYTDESGAQTVISFTVGGTATAAAVSAGLIAAWNGNTTTAAMATASGSSTIILTAVNAGIPFKVASSVTGAGTLTRAATTANSGPSDWATAANWSDGAVPVTGDTVLLDSRMTSAILYSLNQSSVALAELDDYRSRSKQVGSSSAALKVGATVAKIGATPFDGSVGTSAFINVDFGTAQNETTVFATATSGSGGLAPANINANNASNILNVQGGIVGANATGNAGAYATVNVTRGSVFVGANAVPAAVNNAGGSITLAQVTNSMTVATDGGTTTINGSAKVGTVTATGGTTFINNRTSGSDIGTLNMEGGTADFSQSPDSFTCDTLHVAKGGKINLFSASQPTWTATTWDFSDDTSLSVVS